MRRTSKWQVSGLFFALALTSLVFTFLVEVFANQVNYLASTASRSLT